jgi:hypothetical protein
MLYQARKEGKYLQDSTMANSTMQETFAAIEPAFLRPIAILYDAAVEDRKER